MGEAEQDGPREDAPEAAAASAEPDAKRKNDATIALSEQEFLALQVPGAAPPAIPTPRPAPAPIARNDASMWAGSVLVADEFEPLEVPKNPMGRWLLLALFGLGVVAAALYFLWWRPAQDVDASEPAAAKPAEPAAAPVAQAAPAPAPVEAAPVAEPATPPQAQPAVAAPEKPPAKPAPKKTASKKKSSSKKKASAKKSTSSKKKSSKKKPRHGG